MHVSGASLFLFFLFLMGLLSWWDFSCISEYLSSSALLRCLIGKSRAVEERGVSLEDCEQKHEGGGWGAGASVPFGRRHLGSACPISFFHKFPMLCAQGFIVPGGIPIGEVAAFLQVAIRLINMYRATH